MQLQFYAHYLLHVDSCGTQQHISRRRAADVRAILVLRSLPPGIDTTQILIRTDDTRLRVEESSRWVAPLGDEFRGALVDALRHQYGIIVSDGARRSDASVPRIDLTVRKFDVAEGSSIILAVDWVLANPGRATSIVELPG